MSKRWIDWVLTAGGLAFAFLFLVTGGTAFAGIANTKHNLGSTNNQSSNSVSDTAEICVFCHTPHGADVSNPQANPPLWNKRLSTGATYQTYDQLGTSTLDGGVLGVGSVSVACLSCHDGTQAMDNIINAPGSGGYDPTGGGTNGLAYTWTGATVTAEGLMTNPAVGFNIALIGTDLRNDHPIGVEYCGGGLTGAGNAVSGTCRDGDFVAPNTNTINTQQVFWVETNADSTRQRSDMILYTRDFTSVGGSATGASVECASCHDPHVENGQAAPVAGAPPAGQTFLRISNAGSAVCLACHVK
ncbi:MAG TPA: hypothetical protein VLW45_06230 [Pelomicrobium sp.]|nr:hypothetical protein [Pelomicrobium sp.]